MDLDNSSRPPRPRGKGRGRGRGRGRPTAVPGDPFAPRPPSAFDHNTAAAFGAQPAAPFGSSSTPNPPAFGSTPTPGDPFAIPPAQPSAFAPTQAGTGDPFAPTQAGTGDPFAPRPSSTVGHADGSTFGNQSGGFAGQFGAVDPSDGSLAGSSPTSFPTSRQATAFGGHAPLPGHSHHQNLPDAALGDPFAAPARQPDSNAQKQLLPSRESISLASASQDDPFARRSTAPPANRARGLSTQLLLKGVPANLFSESGLMSFFGSIPGLKPTQASVRGSRDAPNARRTALISFPTAKDCSIAMSRVRALPDGAPFLMSYYRSPGAPDVVQGIGTEREETNELLFSFVPEDLFSEQAVRHLFTSISGNDVAGVSVRSRPYRGTVKRTAIITFASVDAARTALENLPLYKGQVLQVAYRYKAQHLSRNRTEEQYGSTGPANSAQQDVTPFTQEWPAEEDTSSAAIMEIAETAKQTWQHPQDEGGDVADAREFLRKPDAVDGRVTRNGAGGQRLSSTSIEEKHLELIRLKMQIAAKEQENAKKNQSSKAKVAGRMAARDVSGKADDEPTAANALSARRAAKQVVNEPSETPGTWRNTGKKVSLEDAVQLVGTCHAMCPAQEVFDRTQQRDISAFETVDGTVNGVVDPDKAVKKYRRSAAISEAASPDEVRPPEVLLRTMEYLNEICDLEGHAFVDIHNFVRDRTRAIRKDFTLQGVRDQSCIKVNEESVRFHIMSEHKLVSADPEKFSSKQNREQLDKCLISLREMYDLRRERGLATSPNEPEMQAYYVLTQMSEPKTCVQLCTGFASDVRRSLPVQFALQVVKAVAESSGNHVNYFACVRAAPYLTACLLESRFVRIRGLALTVINATHGNPTSRDFIPISTLTSGLGFENDEEALQFSEHMGLDVLPMDNDGQEMSGMAIATPSTGFDSDKALEWNHLKPDSSIERKANALRPSEIIQGVQKDAFDISSLPQGKFPQLRLAVVRSGEAANSPSAPLKRTAPLRTSRGNSREKSKKKVAQTVETVLPTFGKRKSESPSLKPIVVPETQAKEQPFRPDAPSSAVPDIHENVVSRSSEPTRPLVDEATDMKLLPRPVAIPQAKKNSPGRDLLGSAFAARKRVSFALGDEATLHRNEAMVSNANGIGPEAQIDLAGRKMLSTPSVQGVPVVPYKPSPDLSAAWDQTKKTSIAETARLKRLQREKEQREEHRKEFALAETRAAEAKAGLDEYEKFMGQVEEIIAASQGSKNKLSSIQSTFDELDLDFEEPQQVLKHCRVAEVALEKIASELRSCLLKLESLTPADDDGEDLRQQLLRNLSDIKILGQEVWQRVWRVRGTAIVMPSEVPRKRKRISTNLGHCDKPASPPGIKRRADGRVSGMTGTNKRRSPKSASQDASLERANKLQPVAATHALLSSMQRERVLKWDLAVVRRKSATATVSEARAFKSVQNMLSTGSNAADGIMALVEEDTTGCRPTFLIVRECQVNKAVPLTADAILFCVGPSTDHSWTSKIEWVESCLREKKNSPALNRLPPIVVLVRSNLAISGSCTRQQCALADIEAWLSSLRDLGLLSQFHVVELGADGSNSKHDGELVSALVRSIGESSRAMAEKGIDLRPVVLGEYAVQAANATWTQLLSASRKQASQPSLDDVIISVNDAWSDTLRALENEHKQWPNEMTSTKNRLRELTVMLQLKLRLPEPRRVGCETPQAYIQYMATTANVACPTIARGTGRSLSHFCRAFAHVLVPYMSALLRDRYFDRIYLPSGSLKSLTDVTPLRLRRRGSVPGLYPPRSVDRAWDKTPVSGRRTSEQPATLGDVGPVASQRPQSFRNPTGFRTALSSNPKGEGHAYRRRLSTDGLKRTLAFSPSTNMRLSRRVSLPTSLQSVEDMHSIYDEMCRTEEAHSALLDDTIASLQEELAR